MPPLVRGRGAIGSESCPGEPAGAFFLVLSGGRLGLPGRGLVGNGR